jgi:hypothetical protein
MRTGWLFSCLRNSPECAFKFPRLVRIRRPESCGWLGSGDYLESRFGVISCVQGYLGFVPAAVQSANQTL